MTGSRNRNIAVATTMTAIVGLLLLAFTTILCIVLKCRKINTTAVCTKKGDDSYRLAYRRVTTDTASSIEHTMGCEIKNKHYVHTRTKKRNSFLSFFRKYENLPLQSLDTAAEYQQGSAGPCVHTGDDDTKEAWSHQHEAEYSDHAVL